VRIFAGVIVWMAIITFIGCLGGVGYFAANGEMDMCIALRTAVLKDEVLYIQAGGGVVYDSDPDAEYEETVNKSRALRRAAEDAGLFAGRGNG
jgi:anthranilate synthase component 1